MMIQGPTLAFSTSASGQVNLKGDPPTNHIRKLSQELPHKDWEGGQVTVMAKIWFDLLLLLETVI